MRNSVVLRLVSANSRANTLVRATCSVCFIIYNVDIWSFREETAIFIN